MREIILIPLVREIKQLVSVREVTHNVNTRAKIEQDERLGKKPIKAIVEEVSAPVHAKSKEEYRRSTNLLDFENQKKLQIFKKDVHVISDDLAKGERKPTLNRADLVVL